MRAAVLSYISALFANQPVLSYRRAKHRLSLDLSAGYLKKHDLLPAKVLGKTFSGYRFGAEASPVPFLGAFLVTQKE